jgi:hypothetical protein
MPITKLPPAGKSMVSDIPAEEGKSITFFTVYWRMSLILLTPIGWWVWLSELPLADEFDCLNSH